LNNFDNKGRKVCCKVLLYKNFSDKVVAPSIAFRVIYITILAGGSSVPLISERKGTDPIGSTCAAPTSPQRGSHDASASLACVRLTGWPVAWNWRRAVLSADAGLLVDNEFNEVVFCSGTYRHELYGSYVEYDYLGNNFWNADSEKPPPVVERCQERSNVPTHHPLRLPVPPPL